MTSIKVYIGLGSNLGDRFSNIQTAAAKLAALDGVESLRLSTIIETQPLASMAQPPYLNAVAEIVTSLDCPALLAACKQIEKDLDRRQGPKWSPRIIDLDILIAGHEIIESAELTVPHKQFHLRTFALAGICEFDASLVHPVLGETVKVLADRLDGSDFYIDPNVPQLISIAGIIGVGKTTLAQRLSAVLNCPHLKEPYENNPFLPKVYQGRKEFALDSQLYFLTQRVKQLTRSNLAAGKIFVSDYIFENELIYAKQFLIAEQLSLYNDIYAAFAGKVTNPVLVIFMKDSCENCLARIHKRNRPYEQDIKIDLLHSIEKGYEELFAKWDKSPVIKLDVSKFDCTQDIDLKQLTKQIKAYIAVKSW